MEHDLQAPQPPLVLDRRTRAFLQEHRCPAAPAGADVAGARAAIRALWEETGPHPDVEEDWLAIPGCDKDRIRVRILRPAGSADPLPVILYLHGLGWMLTDAAAHQQLLCDLALGADAAIVVPEYDRSPEARHPVAVEQCYTVARWIAGNGAECRLDGSRMAVAGTSAGANLAAAVALLANRRGGPRFAHQVLVCPVTDAGLDTSSYHRFAEGYFLERAAMRAFWQQYAPDRAQRAQITASPLRATTGDLEGLPPTLILTAEADVLRDEGEAYAAKLRGADVPVVSVCYQGTIHGFVLFDALRDSDASRAARTQVMDTLHVALHSHGG
ncbi:alpha/beta hydrolase [Nonomuraea rubra]|uniref:Acetyl esterase/lipase n=1 Tax=Nonomuraea rubra TaxID=46180 RepID=A0A7X0U1K9_9ACTN|nr:alpha/beta hydrolase [Nonomuraea rubra]MBB6551791.1 acetyl esterase/lipase [Nonomuraea rubra]